MTRMGDGTPEKMPHVTSSAAIAPGCSAQRGREWGGRRETQGETDGWVRTEIQKHGCLWKHTQTRSNSQTREGLEPWAAWLCWGLVAGGFTPATGQAFSGLLRCSRATDPNLRLMKQQGLTFTLIFCKYSQLRP